VKIPKYQIEMTPEANDHLADLPAHERALLLDIVAEQLPHQPTVQTRNRKPLEENELAPWVLRAGRLRVYYKVREDPPMVTVRAIGTKDRNRVLIGGEEVDLR
jgi:mRNA-degrading endonuclease RelE of RelBE toxin-antitoxin system